MCLGSPIFDVGNALSPFFMNELRVESAYGFLEFFDSFDPLLRVRREGWRLSARDGYRFAARRIEGSPTEFGAQPSRYLIRIERWGG
jgi:hypothetical protein